VAVPKVTVTITRKHAEELVRRHDEIMEKMPEWELESDQQELLTKLKAALGG